MNDTMTPPSKPSESLGKMSNRQLARYLGQCVDFTQETLNKFQQDLLRWQRTAASAYNATNITVRVVQTLGIEQGWWKDRADMEIRFRDAARELAREAKADMVRHMAATKNGEAPPQPVNPPPTIALAEAIEDAKREVMAEEGNN